MGTKGDINEQIKEEIVAIQLDAKNAEAYVNLGWAMASKGKWKIC